MPFGFYCQALRALALLMLGLILALGRRWRLGRISVVLAVLGLLPSQDLQPVGGFKRQLVGNRERLPAAHLLEGETTAGETIYSLGRPPKGHTLG